MQLKKITTCFMLCLGSLLAAAQETKPATDSLNKKSRISAETKLPDSVKKYNPNIAIKRSAILPGWGQATNKKYWKIPIIYGALATTTVIFFYNVNQYNDAKYAYILATDTIPSNDYLIKQPYYSVKDQPQRILDYRNSVRQNVDYSVLFFIIFWGLNVADAAVDAHLKTFDVSPDLSLGIKAGYSPVANTNGLSLVLHIGK